MATYYLTFGQRYSREEHPRFPAATPHGWVTIEALSWESARNHAFRLFGPSWAMLYPAREFKPEFFPRGELARVDLLGQLELTL